MAVVAKNSKKWLHIIAKNGNKRIDLLLDRELESLLLSFLAILCFTKLPKMATICHMTVVAKNGNYLAHDKRLPKMAINDCTLLPKMVNNSIH